MEGSELELQQYLFDLQGYLVIQNVLGTAEIAELNRLIDAQALPSPHERIRFGSAAGTTCSAWQAFGEHTNTPSTRESPRRPAS